MGTLKGLTKIVIVTIIVSLLILNVYGRNIAEVEFDSSVPENVQKISAEDRALLHFMRTFFDRLDRPQNNYYYRRAIF